MSYNLFLTRFFLKITSSKIQYFKAWFWSNWFYDQISSSGKSDVNFSMNPYQFRTDSLFETQTPHKKLNKKELKHLTKSWITQGLQNSLKKKSNIYLKNFIIIITRTMEIFYPHSSKRQKKKYFTNFFNENIKVV